MAIEIGPFQFENLVKNRVPFVLFSDLSFAESSWGPLDKMHLQQHKISIEELSVQAIQQELKSRQVQLQSPIVLFFSKQDLSKKLGEELDLAGYLNVYFVLS
jgi:hypothetical protein